MKVETKSAVILLITLALGAALGMLGQGAWQHARQQQVGALRRPPGFVAHMESIIKPTAEQRPAVHRMLGIVGARNQRIIDSARAALRVEIESMQQQLAPVLTAEQRDRLARMSRLPDPFRAPPPRDGGARDGRGPPPGGPREGREPPPNGPPPGDRRGGGPP